VNRFAFLALVILVSSCSIGRRDLPTEPPPLVDMEEPLERRAEPDDEAQRVGLATGSFTGVRAADRAASLDAMLEAGDGVRVAGIVENSPADMAGLAEDDVILEARTGGVPHALHWPSDWRALELAAPPGSTISLVVDRAGVERNVDLVTVRRVHPPDRVAVERFREESKVGVVVRTATEVEARAAGLGPGAGAVIVGLARGSPWRKAGIVFGDLVTAVDGAPVRHPVVLVDAIRDAKDDARLVLTLARDGATRDVTVGLARRAGELREFSVPFVFDYSYDRGRSETSILLGLYKHTSTRAAWRTRLLWLIEFGGGEADRLEEEGS